MMASSALRCSVSLSRRCVSSKRRAFSSATLMVVASVVSRRTSDSPKACSRSWFSSEDRADHAVAADDRDADARSALVACPESRRIPIRSRLLGTCSLMTSGCRVCRRSLRSRFSGTRARRTIDSACRARRCRGNGRGWSAVVPADADVAGVEYVAQLVADQVDDRLEVQLGGHALLDAVDHGQLGVALLGFLEQPLCLVEQARVLQRDAHARGHGAQQAHLGFAVGVLALVVLEDDRGRGRDRCRRWARATHECAQVGAGDAVIAIRRLSRIR